MGMPTLFRAAPTGWSFQQPHGGLVPRRDRPSYSVCLSAGDVRWAGPQGVGTLLLPPSVGVPETAGLELQSQKQAGPLAHEEAGVSGRVS